MTVGSVRNAFVWSKETSGPLVGRLSARWPAYQIFNSFAAAADVPHSRSFFVPKAVHVVRNGLDLARFQRREYSSDGPTQIVGLGYLLPVKRWERLFRAARELKLRGLDYRIRIVGGGPLGDSCSNRHGSFVWPIAFSLCPTRTTSRACWRIRHFWRTPRITRAVPMW